MEVDKKSLHSLLIALDEFVGSEDIFESEVDFISTELLEALKNAMAGQFDLVFNLEDDGDEDDDELIEVN